MSTSAPILGFFGTGAATEAAVHGFCHSELSLKILLTKRNVQRSARLAEMYSDVQVFDDPQQIIDQSDWLVLALRPESVDEVLGPLNVSQVKKVVSFVLTTSVSELKERFSAADVWIRAAPLPSIRHRVGPLILHPANNELVRIFSAIATPIQVADESEFETLWALCGMLCSFYETMHTFCNWAEEQGAERESAHLYVTKMFEAASILANRESAKDFSEFIGDSATPGGINECTLANLQNSGWYDELRKQLDIALSRVRNKCD